MRVHALRVTAFGPFAGSVDIDVDALSDHGLFLLTGPTGAGKTSVLDAICFGLFGRVPGARQHADRLRSDHAEPGQQPQVRLDVTIGGRRLRLTRSPRWRRPSRRAREGLVTQQAAVVLQERGPDGWTTLTTRIDETQLLLDELLGMTLGQFTQVAMLPQGQFQDFLRAGAVERRQVLERLFGTQRFRDVERWLVDRRARTRADAEAAERAARSIADQLHGAASLEQPVPDDPADWTEWVDAVVEAACRRRDDLSVLVGQSEDVRDRARLAHRRGVECAELRNRGERARRRVEDHVATRTEADEAASALRAADQAGEVALLLEPLADAEQQVAAASVTAMAAVAEVRALVPALPVGVPDHLDAVPAVVLDGWSAALEAERSRTDRRTEREQRTADEVARLQLLEVRTQEAVSAADDATSTTDGIRAAAAAAPLEVRRLRAEIEADLRLDAAHDHLVAAAEALRPQMAAATGLPAAVRRLNTAEQTANNAFVAYRAAADARLDVSRRRIAGIAADLAHGLVDGHPCPVCGSTGHPTPALPTPGHPSETDEAAALQEEKVAERRRHRADAIVADRTAEVARLTAAAAGRTEDEAAAALTELAQQIEAATAARSRLPRSRERLADAERAAVAAGDALDAAVQRARDLTSVATAARRETSALRATLVGALGDDLDISAVRRRTGQIRAALDRAIPAVAALSSAQSNRLSALERADRKAQAHGFADAESARASALDDPGRERLRARLEQRRQESVADAEVLADPLVTAALAGPAPDLDRLAAAESVAEQMHDGQTAALIEARRSAARIVDLAETLRARMATWLPLVQVHHVAAGLAALTEGTAADNRQRMSLSSYVLAARLEQVVAAANERLLPMTSGRYVLEHTVDKAAGDRRTAAGGLGLRVRDEWTGDVRDPATLSGGETFQASLALALGLSDVVGHECGGTQLQTIFVDEGFGALDADSLDDVMDELDRLRDGGRVVGVVSHVDAMRERIPAQLRVTKTRTGSTAAICG